MGGGGWGGEGGGAVRRHDMLKCRHEGGAESRQTLGTKEKNIVTKI